MNEFLRQLSAAYPEDYIILVMDNAIWHKSQTLNIPENIEFTFIPPYTLEMNPIEQVWAEIRKLGFKNKVFKTLNEVINKLEEVIQTLTAYQLKSIVHRDWASAIFDFCRVCNRDRTREPVLHKPPQRIYLWGGFNYLRMGNISI